MQFDVCCKGVNTGPLAHKAEQLKVPIVHIPMDVLQYRFIRNLSEYLRKGNYNVLHSHVGDLSAAAVYAANLAGVSMRISAYHNTQASTALKLKKIPVLSMIRDKYLSVCHNKVLKYSTHISGCSRAALEAYFGELVKTDTRFRVNYYGVDLSRFSTPFDKFEYRKKNNLSCEKLLIGHVGSFRWEKNHKGFLEIAKLITSTFPNVQFVFVGDGGLRVEIEQIAKSDYSQLDIRFLGNRDDIPDIMRSMDLMLFPSIREGFGMVVIEAAAAGVPVVSSSVLGLAEAIAPENLGYTFDPSDYKGAAHLAVKLLTDKQARAEYLKFSAADLHKRFSIDAACSSLYKLYSESLEKKPAGILT
jgi:glycosyltransferase EpsF